MLGEAARPRRWRFVLPHAESIPVTINMGMTMPAWYDILDLSHPRAVNWETVAASQALIEELMQGELAPKLVEQHRITPAEQRQQLLLPSSKALAFGVLPGRPDLPSHVMGHALPQRRGTFMRGGVAIPITISRSRVVESPQPPKETTQERIRRMKAALSVSDDRNRDPAERDTACVVCTNEYATEHNIHEAERVLRVVLDGCNHELCRNCSLAVDKCPICRKEMTGTSTEKSGCADCMVRSALITPSVVRMLPCQHLCLCRGCADARAVDASFVCPVCLENADNWQVVG